MSASPRIASHTSRNVCLVFSIRSIRYMQYTPHSLSPDWMRRRLASLCAPAPSSATHSRWNAATSGGAGRPVESKK